MLPLSLAPFDVAVIIVKCEEESEKPWTTQVNAEAPDSEEKIEHWADAFLFASVKLKWTVLQK